MTHTSERPGHVSPCDCRGWRAAAVTVFVCAACLTASGLPAQAGINVWTSHGPEGGNVCALAIDPQAPTTLYAGTCYAGTGHGVFKSTDGGDTWTGINAGLPARLEVDAIAIDPRTSETVYASVFCGLFKSTDGGRTWGATALNLFCVPEGDAHVLAIDPVAPATVYVGAGSCPRGQCGGGAYKSTDGGDTWTALATGLSRSGVFALAIHPTTQMTLYAGTGEEGVFESTDGGDTWVDIFTSLPLVQALAINPATPKTLYAGTRLGGGVFKSTDGGGHWSASGLTNLDVSALAIDPLAPRTVYAGTNGGGVFKSADAGETWSPLNEGLNNLGVSALALDPVSPSHLYAGAGGGVFAIEQPELSPTPTATATPTPTTATRQASGDGGGCTMAPRHAGNPAWWLRALALVLASLQPRLSRSNRPARVSN